MTLKKIILPALLLLCQLALAQNDTIYRLQEIIITDTQLKNFSETQSVLRLNDSVINRNQSSLTSLLNYNTVIYFKENGLGMVSSPSFRGTTAQQTAVIWNGININSQLNGQADFNVLSTRDFNSISVRAGGGSVIYGSSAIGGSVHLNSELEYKKEFRNTLRLNYGSFATVGGHYRLNVSDEKFSASVSVTRNSSDNDYEYPDDKGENLNGKYYNTSINTAAGYRLDDKNTITLYSYLFDGERHFSLIFPSEIRTKYQNTDMRNMLEWAGYYGKFTSKVKTAYLEENYRYFANIYNEDHSFGRVKTFMGRYDLLYQPQANMRVNAVIDYNSNKGEGSDIINTSRQIGSAAVLFSHDITKKLMYEAGARKEVTDNYESPFLYSFGIKYQPSYFYGLKINTSKNFRVPTFNDLYWQGSGNPDLKPETSWQAELGNYFAYKGFGLSLTGYYIKLKDMLRWLPAGSVWRPQNTNRVRTYGVEALLNYKKAFGIHELAFNTTYGYTRSEDEETGNQLIYVPYHKATAAVSFTVKKLMLYYQFLYNGEVFTRSDNNSRYNLDSYTTGNAGIEYDFGSKASYSIGFQALNVWNAAYQSVEGRYMPGINFNAYLTLIL